MIRLWLPLALAGFVAFARAADTAKSDTAGTVLEREHEFDEGSRVSVSNLSPTQIENLAVLGEVWGFLKYHHPKVTAGELHWDYELLRILPAILSAGDRAAANRVLLRWIEGLGETAAVDRTPPSLADLHFAADLAWMDDASALGADLGKRLRAVHAARSARAGEPQFYIAMAQGIGNPEFRHELPYARIRAGDAGYQLLALFRFWNIIQYWFPYRNLIEEDWHSVLREFVPRLAQASTANEYQLGLMALIARVHDTHANLWSSMGVRPPVGDSRPPAVIRFVDGQAVVASADSAGTEPATALQRGDVILALDGQPVSELLNTWSPYYAASNQPTRLRDFARSLTRGPAGPVKLRVQRGDAITEVETTRVRPAASAAASEFTHNLPGPAFRRLSDQVAYLSLFSAKAADVPQYVEKAAGTKGWILDLRNYPADFPVLFALGGRLVDKPTEFVRFTFGELSNPGAFSFRSGKPMLQPVSPGYSGKIVILVDEVTQSRAEYFAMAFRAAPGAVVIGSTTAGADGNVSTIPLPGNQRSMISGIGVFYPDKRPTQRVGIVPDIEAKPTLAGLRAGRDEVLEAALRHILGPGIADEELRRLSAPAQ